MKSRFLVGAFLLTVLASPVMGQQAQAQQKPVQPPRDTKVTKPKPMTNPDVIQLHKSGLSEKVILERIKTAPTKTFDVSLVAMKALKDAGLSDSVVKAMQETPIVPAAPKPPEAPKNLRIIKTP